jgi:hypothetical protein
MIIFQLIVNETLLKMKRRILAIMMLLGGNNLFAQTQPSFDTVSVGAIKQIVFYSGGKDLPIIFFLHGGPGSSRIKQASVFSNILQQHFLVVQ